MKVEKLKLEYRKLRCKYNALANANEELIKACEFSKELLVSPAIRKLCVGDRLLCELPVRPDVLRDAVNLRINTLTNAINLANSLTRLPELELCPKCLNPMDSTDDGSLCNPCIAQAMKEQHFPI